MTIGLDLKDAAERQAAAVNPKTLMGRLKIPMFSVISPVILAHLGHAMRYGAYEARQKNGTLGYGPYNWRDQAIEYSTYIDAAVRHLAAYWDGDDPFEMEQLEGTVPEGCAMDSRVHHLAHAMATIGILLDAIENGTALDDRPKVRSGSFTRVVDRLKGIHAVHLDAPKTVSAADIEALAATIPSPPPTLADVQALLDKVVLPEGVSSYGITEISPHPAWAGVQGPEATLPDVVCPSRWSLGQWCVLPKGHAGSHKSSEDTGSKIWANEDAFDSVFTEPRAS